MIGGDAPYARVSDRFSGRRISISGERNCLGEAFTLCQNVDHGFVAGWRNAIKLYPSVDHDKKGCRRITLPK
jgi:hypothetical protein